MYLYDTRVGPEHMEEADRALYEKYNMLALV